MSSTLSKADLLKALETALPAESNPTYPLLLDAIRRMIPDEKDQAFLTERENPRVRRAIRLYQRFHPELGHVEPELHTLIDWMLKRGGVQAATDLEKRMSQIDNLLDEFGSVSPEETIPVPAITILRLRVLAMSTNEPESQEEE